MHKIKISKENLSRVKHALEKAERELNYALDIMATDAVDSDEDKCDGDHPLLQVSSAHTAVSEAIQDLAKGFKVKP